MCNEIASRDLGDGTLRVRVSVDGAQMSKKSNFLVMTYGVLNDGEVVMGAAGNKCVAVVNGKECYETLETSFSTIFAEINEIIEEGGIMVNGKLQKVDIFLGGDMKFLLQVTGLSGATANYACIWCKVHKSHRYDTSCTEQFYNSPPVARKIDELVTGKPAHPNVVQVTEGKPVRSNKYSQKNQPLLKIPIPQIVIDELHLMLRVTMS